MRIVYHIDTKATALVFANGPYARREGATESVIDFPCVIHLHCPLPFSDDDSDKSDNIHIEGSAHCIRDALQQAITMIDVLAQLAIEQGELDPDWLKAEWSSGRLKHVVSLPAKDE